MSRLITYLRVPRFAYRVPRFACNQGFSMLLALLLLAAGVSAQTPPAEYRCVVCNGVITKQAAVIDGKLYHPECFRCAECGGVIHDEYVKDAAGKYYHRRCLEQRKQVICAYCNQPITEGNYTEFQNKIYHEACYRKFVAPRCVICGETLGDAFITDFWGNRFHPEHAEQYPVCEACGRLVWKNGVELGGGLWLCPLCSKLSVNDAEKARRLLEETREELATLGIVVRTLGLRVELATREVLDKGRVKEGHSHAFAHVKWKSGGQGVGDEMATIQALDGLPEDMLRGVIAHELMHVWQHENGADGTPLEVREGSANWAASLIYSRMQTQRGQFYLGGLEKSQDPVYGKGYRDVAAYADQHGVDGVLKMLKEKQ